MMSTHECDVLLVTHTGIPWQRRLADGRLVVNVGAIGRPANDGRREVWYAVVTERASGGVEAELVPVAYDWQALADAMRAERLPAEFVETDRDRLVDDVSRDPAGEGADGRAVLISVGFDVRAYAADVGGGS